MQILVSDLDGTLIQDRKIDELVLRKLYHFTNEGNKFVIATGRGAGQVVHLQKATGYSFAVCCNGSLIIDSSGEIIYAKYMDKKDVEKFIKIIPEDLLVFMSDGFDIVRVKQGDAIPYENICFISVTAKDFSAKRVHEFKKEVSELNLNISAVINSVHLDLGPSDISKANGIEIVQEILGVKDEQISVVGDQENDISMCTRYENSYAITDGSPLLKEVSNHQVDNIGLIISDETFDVYK